MWDFWLYTAFVIVAVLIAFGILVRHFFPPDTP